MPLSAICSTGKKYLLLQQDDKTRKELLFARESGAAFSCPHCKHIVLFVNGTRCVYHFRHDSPCLYASNPESEKHLRMKLFFKKLLPDSDVEVIVGNRIADVCVPNGVVVECQCSPISVNEIMQRTADYTKAGHPVMWVWGHRGEDSFYPTEEDEYGQCFNTDREGFIQAMTGKNLYCTVSDRIWSGKFYGNKVRKQKLFANQITEFCGFELHKQRGMEFAVLKGPYKSNPIKKS